MSTPAGTHPHGALTSAIAEDHEEMYSYHTQYKSARAAGNADEQTRWARQLIWEVARHAVGEELVVYPLMEKHLGEEGKKLADEDRVDHQFVKEKLYKIESLTPGSTEYDSLLSEVMTHLHEHNDNEETKDLPKLEPALAAIGPNASADAAKSFSRSKKFAPTRAHPSAPNQPPLETLAGFLALPLDKLKDMFAKFPTEEMKEKAES